MVALGEGRACLSKPSEPEPTERLRSDRDFVLLWSGSSVSYFGSGVTRVVLPILVYQQTGSAALTALLVTAQASPYLLFGFVAGAVADRMARLRLMALCNLFSAVAVASLPIAGLLGILTVPQIFVVALLLGGSFVLFDAASFGTLPVIVGRQRIPQAMGTLASTETVLLIAAPMVAGVLVGLVSPVAVLWIDIGSYLVSAGTLSQIRRGRGVLTSGPPTPMLRDIVEGLRFVWRNQLIRPLTAAGFGINFTAGAIVSLIVVYGVRQLGLGVTDPLLGVLYAAGSVGSLLATTTLPWLAKRMSPPRMTVGVLALNVAAVFTLVAAQSFVVGVICLVAWWATWTFVNLNGITLRQQLTPDALQGRVNTSARAIAYAGQPIGAAVAAAVSSALTLSATFLVVAVGVIAATATAWFSPLRRVDRTEFSRLLAKAGDG